MYVCLFLRICQTLNNKNLHYFYRGNPLFRASLNTCIKIRFGESTGRKGPTGPNQFCVGAYIMPKATIYEQICAWGIICM